MTSIQAIRYRLTNGLKVVINDIEIKLSLGDEVDGIHLVNATMLDIGEGLYLSKMYKFRVLYINNFWNEQGIA